MIRLNVWSGPRNVSTALMYSFRQHPAVTVVDEPLYGWWLSVSGADHPGRDDVLASMELDASNVLARLRSSDWPTPALMCKQMAHHLPTESLDWLDDFANVLLVRDPREVLLSYSKGVEHPDVDMLGYPNLVRILDRELAQGRAPVVVESRDLLDDPPRHLTRMCQAAGLEFDPVMLSWPPGPKPEDGVWAAHWYHGVHASTGFSAYRPRHGDLRPDLVPVLEQAQPLYDRLLTHARN